MGIAAFSTFVALAAAIIAAKAFIAQLRAPARDRRSAYYRTIVLEPAMDALRDFQDSATALLDEKSAHIGACQAVQDAKASVADLIVQFKELVKPLRYRLLTHAQAWKDDELHQELAQALLVVEDVTTAFPDIMSGGGKGPAPRDLLQGAIATVLGTVTHYDLALDVPPDQEVVVPKIVQAALKRLGR